MQHDYNHYDYHVLFWYYRISQYWYCKSIALAPNPVPYDFSSYEKDRHLNSHQPNMGAKLGEERTMNSVLVGGGHDATLNPLKIFWYSHEIPMIFLRILRNSNEKTMSNFSSGYPTLKFWKVQRSSVLAWAVCHASRVWNFVTTLFRTGFFTVAPRECLTVLRPYRTWGWCSSSIHFHW